MEQQARVFLDYAGEQRLACEILTRDHDGAFSKAFDQLFKDDGGDVLPLDPNKIKCERRLGGILKHDYRDAA